MHEIHHFAKPEDAEGVDRVDGIARAGACHSMGVMICYDAYTQGWNDRVEGLERGDRDPELQGPIVNSRDGRRTDGIGGDLSVCPFVAVVDADTADASVVEGLKGGVINFRREVQDADAAISAIGGAKGVNEDAVVGSIYAR